MNRATAAILNEVNRRFYATRAREFAATRKNPWKGWVRIWEIVEARVAPSSPPRILDVGCGNGRLGRFLAERAKQPILYEGIDASRDALERARSAVPDAKLHRHDLVGGAPLLPSGLDPGFDLVCVFGLLHHIPGFSLRRDLLRALAGLLAPHGILALAIWQFGSIERFRKKILPWRRFIEDTGAPLELDELEPGDFLLAWGENRAYRYCHFVGEEEEARLLESLPLEHLAHFDADGATGDLNRYHVWKAGSAPELRR